jgi:hypothetical protein
LSSPAERAKAREGKGTQRAKRHQKEKARSAAASLKRKSPASAEPVGEERKAHLFTMAK